MNGVNGHSLLTAVDSIAEEDEGDIDGDDAVTATLAKERTLSTNSNRYYIKLVLFLRMCLPHFFSHCNHQN